MAQVRTLAAFVAEHAADCGYPPGVTGDFNAEPGSEEVRLLGGVLTTPAVPDLVLAGAWQYAAPGDPGFTWDHRNGYQAGTVLPDSRIDYILACLGRAAARCGQPRWPAFYHAGSGGTGVPGATAGRLLARLVGGGMIDTLPISSRWPTWTRLRRHAYRRECARSRQAATHRDASDTTSRAAAVAGMRR
jgi:hypothetical protein